MYISITLSAYINVSTAFGEKHNWLRDSRLSLARPSGGLRLVADKTTKKKKKIKPRVDYEPRSAHGRAVNKRQLEMELLTSSLFLY